MGAGRRPATVSHTPAAGQSPPGIASLPPAKRRATRGVLRWPIDLPSHLLPQGFALPTGWYFHSPWRIRPLPASLRTTSQPSLHHHQRRKSRSGSELALPSCSPPPDLLEPLVSHRHFVATACCLPASLATTATSERHHEDDQSKSFHHAPRLGLGLLPLPSARHLRAVVRQAARAAAVPFARSIWLDAANILVTALLRALQVAGFGGSWAAEKGEFGPRKGGASESV